MWSGAKQGPVLSAKENAEEIVFKSYPVPKGYIDGSGDTNTFESNTEVIIAALQKLQKKLLQLEQEKDAAVMSVSLLVSECNEMREYLNLKKLEYQETASMQKTELRTVRADCRAIEKELSDIIREIRDVREPAEPVPKGCKEIPAVTSVSGGTSNKKSTVITITKMPLPFGDRRKLRVAKDDFDGRTMTKLEPHVAAIKPLTRRTGQLSSNQHLKLNLKQVLPFVPSTVTGPSHSLPANIQMLLASLSRHNPWLCALAGSSDVTVEMILKTKKDLKDVIVSLQYGIECLTHECRELGRQMSSTQTSNKLTTLQQRKRQLCHHRNELVNHVQKICDLQNQLQSLLKHFRGRTDKQEPEAPTAPKRAKIPKTALPTHPHKRSYSDSQKQVAQGTHKLALPPHQKTKSSIKPRRKRDWVSTLTQPNRQPTSNLHNYRYVQLLQYALRKNGLKLNTRTDK